MLSVKINHAFFTTIIVSFSFIVQAMAQNSRLDSLLDSARQLRITGEMTMAIAKYRESLAIAEKNRDSLTTANSLIGIGIVHDQSGRFETALENYFRALDIYQRINNLLKAGGTIKNIGNVYRNLKQYDKALKFLWRAYDIQSERKDSASTGNVLNDIGLVYMDQDSNQKALEYFSQVIKTYGTYVNDDVKANVLNNLALTHMKLKEYPVAMEYYFSSLAMMRKINYQYGIALVLGNLGYLYYTTSNFEKALDYQFQSLAIAQQIKSDDLLLNSYNNLRKTYQATGNYQKAYLYSLGEMDLKDTIYKHQSIVNYEEMHAKYQYDKDQQDILLLQQKNQIANIEVSNQRRTKYFLLTGIILVLALGAILYRAYRDKQKMNSTLNILNDRLSEANQSKTKLLGIISHDLRSPISSLFGFLQLQKMKSAGLEDRDSANQEIIQSAHHLLDSMEDLLIWAKSQMDYFLPSNEVMDVDELFKEIVRLNEPLASTKNIGIQQKAVPGLQLCSDPNFLRIILRNLMSNALKFTPAGGNIILSCSVQNGFIKLAVADNGPGISTADLAHIFEWNSIRSDSSGLGLRLAKEFTEKLGGKLEVKPVSPSGTEFIVSLPVSIPHTVANTTATLTN